MGRKRKATKDNIKVISLKDHILYQEVDEINEDGRDGKGKFRKGNKCASLGKVKARIAADIAASCSDDEAAARMRDLLYSGNENVAIKALTLWLAYRHGRPIQMVQTENKHEVTNEDLPADLAALIADFNIAVGEE
jgi:hypothetical protein